jgi:hypothetical protein
MVEQPELRIVSEELWQAVQARQSTLARLYGGDHRGLLNRSASSGNLLTGFLKCGLCGANLVTVTGRRRRHAMYSSRMMSQVSTTRPKTSGLLGGVSICFDAADKRMVIYLTALVLVLADNSLRAALGRAGAWRSGLLRGAFSVSPVSAEGNDR